MRKKGEASRGLSRLDTALPKKEPFGKRLYTVPELLRLTGMTRRQASYWDKTGLLNPTLRRSDAPTGKPSSFYSAADVIKALIVCHLRRSGFTPSQVQQVARNLEEHRIRLDAPETYLLTDGYSVYYAHSDNEVVDIHKHNGQMLLLVPIHEQVEKLRKAA
jgi:DNA-binding transcriptional MerR regulator